MQINDVTPVGERAYNDYIAAAREHESLVRDLGATQAQRIAAAMDVIAKKRVALDALGDSDTPNANQLREYKQRLTDTVRDRAELHEAAMCAQAMMRGIMEIGGFDNSTGEEAELCLRLLHEAHGRLASTLAKVQV